MDLLAFPLGERTVGAGDVGQHGGEVDRLAPDRDVERVHHGVGDQVVDHTGELRGRAADMGELLPDLVDRHRPDGGKLVEHLGAAEDDGQRILEIVRDGAQHLVLELVGASKPGPLQGQAVIGGGQGAGAVAHALLELHCRVVELLVENDVVEGDGQAAAEHLHQRAVGGGQRPPRLQQHDHLAPGGGADVEHRHLRLELVRAALERIPHHLPQFGFERGSTIGPGHIAIAAGAGQNRRTSPAP